MYCGRDKYDELKVNRLFEYISNNQDSWEEFIKMADDLGIMKEISGKTKRGRTKKIGIL